MVHEYLWCFIHKGQCTYIYILLVFFYFPSTHASKDTPLMKIHPLLNDAELTNKATRFKITSFFIIFVTNTRLSLRAALKSFFNYGMCTKDYLWCRLSLSLHFIFPAFFSSTTTSCYLNSKQRQFATQFFVIIFFDWKAAKRFIKEIFLKYFCAFVMIRRARKELWEDTN